MADVESKQASRSQQDPECPLAKRVSNENPGRPSPIGPTLELSPLLQNAAQALRTLLEIDRVTIYTFHRDGSGEAIAESADETHLPALLGLRFQAEEFPVPTYQCAIADVALEVQSADVEGAMPMNFCHCNVLKTMGVRSSLVVPIVTNEHLWGLLAAHHSQSRSYSDRELQWVRFGVEQLAVAIAQDQLLQRTTEQAKHEAIASRISSILHANQTFSQRQQAALEEIANALECDGARLYIFPCGSERSAQLYLTGDQPNLPYLEETPFWQKLLVRATLPEEPLEWEFCPLPRDRHALDATICAIPDLYRDSQLKGLKGAFQTTKIRSILIVPLRYYQRCVGGLTLFRREIATETLWAGQTNPDPRNQLPRQSFAAWQSANQGLAPNWRSSEIKLARVLGLHLYMASIERRLQDTIAHHSNHDRLTGLANRMLFRDRLSLELTNRPPNPEEMLAVLFLDLDGFKIINDTLGHDAGDRLLQHVGNRLVSCLRAGDLVARWGGDEFTILLQGITSTEKAAARALKMLAALSVPFQFNDQNLYIKASLGIALAPYHGEDADTLLKHADAALYRAKQQGRNTYQLYNPAIGNNAQQRLQLEHNLYLALERQEFCLYYQPQIAIATGKIVAMEALLRWISPELGWVSPTRFIPLAEETGLINLIGEWVLHAAASQSKMWQALDLPPIQISVNLSARQFQDKQLLGIVTRILEATGINPHQLELEITESVAMQDLELTVSVLRSLRQLGIQIAIDDFGTGYSSLASLKLFPLDKLKIERSFVRDLTLNSQDAAIISAIVALGSGLGLKVVAEGVETEEQFAFLHQVGCDVAQGYFLSRPLPANEATQFLSKHHNHFGF